MALLLLFSTSLFLSKAEECSYHHEDFTAILWTNFSVCSKQEKSSPYKEFRELICLLEKTPVRQKVLLRPTCLYFEEIFVVLCPAWFLPGELSRSICWPICFSFWLNTVVFRLWLIPRDSSECRKCHRMWTHWDFLKSNREKTSNNHHQINRQTKPEKRWNSSKIWWGSRKRGVFKIVFVLTRSSGCQDTSCCWRTGLNGHFTSLIG